MHGQTPADKTTTHGRDLSAAVIESAEPSTGRLVPENAWVSVSQTGSAARSAVQRLGILAAQSPDESSATIHYDNVVIEPL